MVAFALRHTRFGPARIAAELAQPRWGAITLSTNGVWRVLRRHGLSTRAKHYGLVAGYAAPPAPERPPPPERHLNVDHPGQLVQLDCFCIGRLSGTKGTVCSTPLSMFRPSEQARTWQRGAHGERRTAHLLDRLTREGFVVFHDLAVPGSRPTWTTWRSAPPGCS